MIESLRRTDYLQVLEAVDIHRQRIDHGVVVGALAHLAGARRMVGGGCLVLHELVDLSGRWLEFNKRGAHLSVLHAFLPGRHFLPSEIVECALGEHFPGESNALAELQPILLAGEIVGIDERVSCGIFVLQYDSPGGLRAHGSDVNLKAVAGAGNATVLMNC